MNIDNITGTLAFGNQLILTPFITKKEIMEIDGFDWEPWPNKGDDTVSYRTIFNMNRNKQGDIYLIVDFVRSNNMSATLSSWRFAPEKLLMGEQKKIEGVVTRRLREWFKEKSCNALPIYGSWGHIDAAYDPHNKTGTIFCNYRSAFKDEKDWKDYCKWNNIKV